MASPVASHTCTV